MTYDLDCNISHHHMIFLLKSVYGPSSAWCVSSFNPHHDAVRLPMLNSWIFVACECLRTRCFFVSETYSFFVGSKPNPMEMFHESTNISVTFLSTGIRQYQPTQADWCQPILADVRQYFMWSYANLYQQSTHTGWWFGTFGLFFQNIWDNPSHWLSYMG